MFKHLKRFLQRILFHPFGYEIVPLKPRAMLPQPPRVKPPLVVPGKENLELYVQWFGEQAVRERRFYNVGAEENFQHPAWTRVNYASERYGATHFDLEWDLLSDLPLPVEKGKANVIFTRYTLEHVTNQAVEHFLAETWHALTVGGFLRIVVPNIDLYYAAYEMKDAAFFYHPKHDFNIFPNEDFLSNINVASFEQKLLWSFASSVSTLHADGAPERVTDDNLRRVLSSIKLVDALDYCKSKCSLEVQRRHPNNHINWFTPAKLEDMIRKAGFTKVYRSGYGQSQCPVLRDTALLEARQPEKGLFMEAQKS